MPKRCGLQLILNSRCARRSIQASPSAKKEDSRVTYTFLVYMPPPIPRCSSWAYSSLISPSHFSLPRKGCRVGLHIVLFEACSAFTRVAACTLALSPIRDTLIEG